MLVHRISQGGNVLAICSPSPTRRVAVSYRMVLPEKTVWTKSFTRMAKCPNKVYWTKPTCRIAKFYLSLGAAVQQPTVWLLIRLPAAHSAVRRQNLVGMLNSSLWQQGPSDGPVAAGPAPEALLQLLEIVNCKTLWIFASMHGPEMQFEWLSHQTTC